MQKWNGIVCVFLTIIFLMIAGCVGEVEDNNLIDDGQSVEFYAIEGVAIFENEPVQDVHVFVVDSTDLDAEPIDQTITTNDGYYILEVEQPGDYIILAGQENSGDDLVFIDYIDVSETNTVFDINLISQEPNSDFDYKGWNCTPWRSTWMHHCWQVRDCVYNGLWYTSWPNYRWHC